MFLQSYATMILDNARFVHHFHPVRLAYQPPASSNKSAMPSATSQQYFSLRKDQHQSSATSQPNRLFILGIEI
jgi:hypothetical protein